MKETVLLINFQDPARLRQVKQALLPLRLKLRTVAEEEWGCPVGALAAGTPEGKQGWTAGQEAVAGQEAPAGQAEAGQEPAARQEAVAGQEASGSLEGELLVFAGFSGGTLDRVLAALRKKGLRIPYKAVMTAANQGWTVRQLHREIQAEHAAMTGLPQ